jgi:cytochrome c553
MSRRRIAAAAFTAAAVLFVVVPSAVAQDVTAGRKALACQACHGLDGIAKLPDAPNLAGQPATISRGNARLPFRRARQ